MTFTPEPVLMGSARFAVQLYFVARFPADRETVDDLRQRWGHKSWSCVGGGMRERGPGWLDAV